MRSDEAEFSSIPLTLTLSQRERGFVIALLAICLLCCAERQKPDLRSLPDEVHLADLRRLTFGGQNAEAYWSFDGAQLSFQARRPGELCDRIYRMSAEGGT